MCVVAGVRSIVRVTVVAAVGMAVSYVFGPGVATTHCGSGADGPHAQGVCI